MKENSSLIDPEVPIRCTCLVHVFDDFVFRSFRRVGVFVNLNFDCCAMIQGLGFGLGCVSTMKFQTYGLDGLHNQLLDF